MPARTPQLLLDDGTLGVWAMLDAAEKAPPTGKVSVRFLEEAREGGVSVLEVERSGPLPEPADLQQALFQLRIQVVGSPGGSSSERSHRASKGSVERLQVVEFDGGPITRRRQVGLCADLAALLGGEGSPRRSPITEAPPPVPG